MQVQQLNFCKRLLISLTTINISHASSGHLASCAPIPISNRELLETFGRISFEYFGFRSLAAWCTETKTTVVAERETNGLACGLHE